MLGFKRIGIAALSAFLLVLCLQPVYFLAMTNLDRIVAHERTWQHIREAFDAGVLETGYHSRNQFIDSGDRYTDCASLGIGLQPGVSDAVEGITGPRPSSDNHTCDDLKAAAINPGGAVWSRSERYWNGFRVFSAPLVSVVSILALKLINLVLLAIVSVLFFAQGSKLVGAGPAIGLLETLNDCLHGLLGAEALQAVEPACDDSMAMLAEMDPLSIEDKCRVMRRPEIIDAFVNLNPSLITAAGLLGQQTKRAA